jgi:segregation and condensation protein A
VAAEYLVMAATLAHLKSRMLLPPSEGESEEEGEDPRAELARHLAEYAVFKDAAVKLDSHALLGRDVFASQIDVSRLPEKRACSVSLFSPSRPCRACSRGSPGAGAAHGRARVTLQQR